MEEKTNHNTFLTGKLKTLQVMELFVNQDMQQFYFIYQIAKERTAYKEESKLQMLLTSFSADGDSFKRSKFIV